MWVVAEICPRLKEKPRKSYTLLLITPNDRLGQVPTDFMSIPHCVVNDTQKHDKMSVKSVINVKSKKYKGLAHNMIFRNKDYKV